MEFLMQAYIQVCLLSLVYNSHIYASVVGEHKLILLQLKQRILLKDMERMSIMKNT